ncbi:MAG: ABC transporter substrate-binding protein [Acidobacteria bacterium]|nr:ABC transporter substrate-binding protein [Acidobacteriota bacterium]
MNRVFVSFLLIVSFISFPAPASNPESASHPRMIVLYMPVHRSVGQLWLDSTGHLRGVRVHLLQVLNRNLKPLGIKLCYRITRQGELPIGRCIDELAQNRYQAYLGLGISPERKKKGILYSRVPLYTVPNVLWMLKKNAFPYKGLSSLKGKRIGTVCGKPILIQPKFEKMLTLDRSAMTPAINVNKLLHGRLDAIVDPLSSTGTVVLQMGVENRIEFCLTCLPASKAFIGYSPAVPESVRTQIDRILERLGTSGEIQNIMFSKLLDKLRKDLINGEN